MYFLLEIRWNSVFEFGWKYRYIWRILLHMLWSCGSDEPSILLMPLGHGPLRRCLNISWSLDITRVPEIHYTVISLHKTTHSVWQCSMSIDPKLTPKSFWLWHNIDSRPSGHFKTQTQMSITPAQNWGLSEKSSLISGYCVIVVYVFWGNSVCKTSSA